MNAPQIKLASDSLYQMKICLSFSMSYHSKHSILKLELVTRNLPIIHELPTVNIFSVDILNNLLDTFMPVLLLEPSTISTYDSFFQFQIKSNTTCMYTDKHKIDAIGHWIFFL